MLCAMAILYNILIATNDSMSASVINLLSNTLQPQLQQATQRDLDRARTAKGFATELMVIADDNSQDISIRQSALIVLKNMVYD